MPSRLLLKLAAIATAIALLVAVVEAWRADRSDRAHLAAELAATKQLLVAADARQHDRDAQLAQTLAALEAQKRAVVTPAQIARELQKSIPLPAAIILQPDSAVGLATRFSASPTSSSPQPPAAATEGSPAATAAGPPTPGGSLPQQAAPGTPNAEKSPPNGAFIPRSDLKPLYDFTLDCQACQAKLSAAQGDLADERQKTAALTKEREDALRVVKGGSTWQRMGRAAKWLLIGAAAGAVLAKTQTR